VSCNDQAIILRVPRDLTSIISQFEFCQSFNAKCAVVSGFPLVFANMSSFQGQPPNLDVSYDIDFLYFPPYESSTTIMFDSCTHRSPATVAEKRGKRLGLDVSDAQLANKDPARTANSIKAPMVDDISSRPGAPRASPLKQLWSRLRHAVKTHAVVNKVLVLLIGCLRHFSSLEQVPSVIQMSPGRTLRTSASGKCFRRPWLKCSASSPQKHTS
jgi:hypothetical protein